MTMAAPIASLGHRVVGAAKDIGARAFREALSFASALVQAAGTADPVPLLAHAGADRLSVSCADGEVRIVAGTEAGGREAAHWAGKAESTVLRLLPEVIVFRRLTLPTHNAEHIAAILRNRIDRLGPWPADQALFGFRVISSGGKDAEVAVAIAGRSSVDAWKMTLEAAGLNIDAVEAETADGPITLERHIPLAVHRKARQFMKVYAAGMAALVLLVSLSAGFASRESSRLDALEARLGADTVAALAAGEGRPDPAEALLVRRETVPPLLVPLCGITRALPDGAWLTSLTIADGRIEMAGEARDAPALIGALQRSGLRDVAFSAPSMRSQAGRSSFAITAQLGEERSP